MQDVTEKIKYIYFNIDGICQFFMEESINDHAKRCFMRRFFILLDSYLEMIGFLKNQLARNNTISVSAKKNLEKHIKIINTEWTDNYEIIRNKFSAHHQSVDEVNTLAWWNEIDCSTISFYYDELQNIREILTTEAGMATYTPSDYSKLDFSNTSICTRKKNSYYVSHDRLAQAKENTIGILPQSDFQKKCMLILTIVDFIFACCTITSKTERPDTYYKVIIFDSAWLLLSCDTCSLIENMYVDDEYGLSLASLCPPGWNGKDIIEKGKLDRNLSTEESIRILRNKFAAHIDTNDSMTVLQNIFNDFNLKMMHDYLTHHMQIFQRACASDVITKMFLIRDTRLSDDVVGLAYTQYKEINK